MLRAEGRFSSLSKGSDEQPTELVSGMEENAVL